MYYKISPAIIILLVIITIAVILLGFAFLKKDNISNNNQIVDNPELSDIVPTLDLKSNTYAENQESVTITVLATTEDENGIYAITLPDGSIRRTDNLTYTVTKNGNYTFKVKGNNGKTSSLTIEINNIREASPENPYMPTGFHYIGGEVNTGYVIQDGYGNEYVWVPVPSGKMIRNRMLDTKYEESNNTASGLVNSVAQNYGFYIGRFEASGYQADNQKIAASIGNRVPWVNVTFIEAQAVASKMASIFGYDGYTTAIMNSYAWDTVLNWIDQTNENYSTNTSYGNYSGNIRNTGTTESDIKNNVCDLSGNVREWTTEIYRFTNNSKNSNSRNITNEILSETVNYRVVRGGSAILSRTASGYTGYKENISDPYWGFRMILYK